MLSGPAAGYLVHAATFDRKRSTDDRKLAACSDRSRAVARTRSAERLVFSVAVAVPAMLRATLSVPAAACPIFLEISIVAAFCWLTAAAIVDVKLSISAMIDAMAPTLSTACLVADCTSAIWEDISSVALAVW